MTKPKFVYVTYIRATPEKVCAALTDQQTIAKYWFGITAECDWKPGSPWRLKFDDGRTADTGEILEAVPHKRLVIGNWQNQFKPELKAAGPARCTIELEVAEYYPGYGGKAVKLTITHEAEAGQGAPLIERCPAAGQRSCPTSSRCSRPAMSRSTRGWPETSTEGECHE
jgi:uncharacterized protein YndB with AHSA1/START domain